VAVRGEAECSASDPDGHRTRVFRGGLESLGVHKSLIHYCSQGYVPSPIGWSYSRNSSGSRCAVVGELKAKSLPRACCVKVPCTSWRQLHGAPRVPTSASLKRFSGSTSEETDARELVRRA
jgi:hypothetical protein